MEPPKSIIAPKNGWIALDFRELIHYRELLYFLTWRDIKVRYKQTVLGAVWAILQPVVTMVVFSVIFGRLAKMPSQGLPYPIFVYAGLLPWTFFATSISGSGSSLIASANLISKVYFPRIFVPTAKVMASLVDFAIACLILFALMVYYRIGLTWNLCFIPVAIFLTILTAFGVGSFLSAVSVRYRDFQYLIPFLVQFWMYCSPVIYPLTKIPPRWRWVLSLNPMAGIIDSYRASFLGKPFDWNNLAISSGGALLLFLWGLYYFTSVERKFADVI